YDHDPSLREAFLYASGGRFEEDLLSKLEKHTYTVYIIANVQNMQELKEVIEVGNGVLDAGGLALKIETAGVAYSKDEWTELAENKEIFPI
ncbi:endopeptidase, partial [Klebsiella pneumoniae]|nr:endopeptidase [Klebsiella pneumoniae]